MACNVHGKTSSRNGFTINKMPTVRGSVYGYSTTRYTTDMYTAIIDSVYEMAVDIVSANGVSPEQAIDDILKCEGWYLLLTHKKMLVEKLKLED